MSQPALFDAAGTGTHDALERHYTPQRLADVLCEILDAYVFEAGFTEWRRPDDVEEPSVGGGAFARAARKVWPDAFLRGVDLDPDAAGAEYVDEFIPGDYLICARSSDLVVGNTPFSVDVAVPHVLRAIESAPVVGLILPWACLGGPEVWAPIMHGAIRPAFVWPIAGRPWPANVRETAFYVWLRDERRRTEIPGVVRWS